MTGLTKGNSMARRSPMNNRYQKGTEPKGVSRKSPARAKPKRAIGEQNSGPIKSTKSKAGTRGSARTNKAADKKGSFLKPMPETPEYKRYRKVWWYCLGAAFVLLILSLGLGQESITNALNIPESVAGPVGLAMTFMAMLMVAYSWYIDLKKIRPIVRDFDAENEKNDSSKKAGE